MIYFRKGKFTEEQVGLDLGQPAFRTGYGFLKPLPGTEAVSVTWIYI